MPSPCGGEIGCRVLSTQVAARGTRKDPPGRARRVARLWQRGLVADVVVEAHVHPHVAPAIGRHRLLPDVALVVSVVARLVDIRETEVDDRPAESMMTPMPDAMLHVTLDLPHAGAD